MVVTFVRRHVRFVNGRAVAVVRHERVLSDAGRSVTGTRVNGPVVNGVEMPITDKELLERRYAAERADLFKRQPPDISFDLHQLARGSRVELEHTNDLGTAKTIAKAHLTEDKDYYRKLYVMEHSRKFQKYWRECR